MMTRKTQLPVWRVLLLLALLLPLAAQATSAAPPPPDEAAARAQTEALVAAYRSCCAKAGGQHDLTCRAVDPFFDYRALAKRTLLPMRKVLTPRQRERLEAAVTQIFARTAHGSGQPFCAKAPSIVEASLSGTGVVVSLEVTEEGEDVPSRFAFVWQKGDRLWQVQDLLVEGGSLITDYQNQFARIRQKEGTTGLLSRIEARLARANQQGATVRDKDSI